MHGDGMLFARLRCAIEGAESSKDERGARCDATVRVRSGMPAHWHDKLRCNCILGCRQYITGLWNRLTSAGGRMIEQEVITDIQGGESAMASFRCPHTPRHVPALIGVKTPCGLGRTFERT
jgi:hypothetical protein